MEVFEGYRAMFRPLSSPAVALGNFDGVHIGHQALLAAAVAHAEGRDGDAVVYTFDPHPAAVLAPDLAPALITPLARKLELFAAAGISVCVVEPFTRELASMAPDDFLRGPLVEVMGAKNVVVGYDFTYGHKRQGTTKTLEHFAEANGLVAEVIEPVSADGLVASSTKVREFIRTGNLAGAALLLGRPYDVDGTVVQGAGRGRTIGVPTANVGGIASLLPPPGVYAAMVQVLDAPLSSPVQAAVNLGRNPTFEDRDDLSLEAHLLDWEGDLYDRPVRVEFRGRIRGEQRFDGPEALVAQIRTDIEAIRLVLKEG